VDDWSEQCAAIVPCLNEAPRVRQLVAQVRRHVAAVVVVDDGSWDGTGEAAAAAGAVVFRQPSNMGKGMALRAGFERARAMGFTWALTMDGDGQHATEDIPRLFACAEATRASLVIGNRMCRREEMPWLRRHVNRWMSARLSRLAGCLLSDSQCGFRLINLPAIEPLRTGTCHFEFESELLLASLQAGLPVAFVPIQVIYGSGKSEIRPIVDGWRWLRWWFSQPRRAPLARGARLLACNTMRAP
jgi:glycosyltransferase involved in cell wall biosynthesis